MAVEQPSRCCIALVLAAALALVAAPAASAATITVTSTNDAVAVDGTISLREALTSINNSADANADVTHTGTYGSGDTVVVPAAAAHYAVTAGELVASKTLTITGGGAATTVLDAGGASRVLHITSAGHATLAGLTITGGHTTAAPGGGGIASDSAPLTISGSSFPANTAAVSGGQTRGGGALWLGGGGTIDSSSFANNTVSDTAGVSNNGGGAIFGSNLGLTITNSTFVQNSASVASGSNNGGGAVYQDGSSMTLTGDAFTGNSADITVSGVNPQSNGGGAVYQDGTVLTVTGTTFSANSVSVTNASQTSGGGALFHDGSTLSLSDSTFTGNSASPLATATGIGGGGILTNSGSQLTSTNATIDGNSTSGAGGNVLNTNPSGTLTSKNTIFAGGSASSGPNCAGPGGFASAGHNIEDSAPSQCGLGSTGDMVGAAPLLGPLQGNGGPTQTQELLTGSPAIDAGDGNGCPATDQRGLGRPQGPVCDIGAVEVAPPSTATSAASDVGTSSATLNGSAANPNALIGGAVFFQFGRDTGYGSQTPAQLLAPGAPVTAFSAGATGLPSGTVIHYRAVAITADGVGFGADQTFTTAAVAPSLAALRIRPSTFRSKPGRGPSIARRPPLIGASVSYRDSQAATTTFTAQRALKGFRSGPRCVAKRPRSGKPRRCTRYRSSGAFTHTDRMGSNSFHFSGRVKRRPLAVGRYRLRAVARNAAGLKSAARFATFRIVG